MTEDRGHSWTSRIALASRWHRGVIAPEFLECFGKALLITHPAKFVYATAFQFWLQITSIIDQREKAWDRKLLKAMNIPITDPRLTPRSALADERSSSSGRYPHGEADSLSFAGPMTGLRILLRPFADRRQANQRTQIELPSCEMLWRLHLTLHDIWRVPQVMEFGQKLITVDADSGVHTAKVHSFPMLQDACIVWVGSVMAFDMQLLWKFPLESAHTTCWFKRALLSIYHHIEMSEHCLNIRTTHPNTNYINIYIYIYIYICIIMLPVIQYRVIIIERHG